MFMSGYIWYSSAPGGIGGPGVTSVQGMTGAVSLSSGDIPESSNLYFTELRSKSAVISQTVTNGVVDFSPSEDAVYDALQNYSPVGHTHVTADITDFNTSFDSRFNTRFSTKTTDDLTEGVVNKYYSSSLFSSDFSTKDTDDLVEGSLNLYFTDLRAQSAFTAGSGIDITAGVISNTYSYNLPIASPTTLGGIKVGTGLNIDVDGVLSAIGAVVSVFGRTGTVTAQSGDYTTSLVAEGTNLYFTEARARGSVGGTGVIQYSSSSGIFSMDEANTLVSGYLSSTDWNIFNSKQDALSLGNLSTSTAGINISGGSNAVVGSGSIINIDTASSSLTGLLSNTDWSTFNSKQSALTFGSISSPNSAITVVSGNSSTVGPNVTIDIANASATVIGLLTNTDWVTFNNKQNALGFTPEDVANKSSNTALGTSNTLYPTQNAVKQYVDNALAGAGAVSSVFGRTGAVTAQSGDYTTDQVTEGSNLYYTSARFNTAFNAKTTDDLAEGSNLYFTNSRARLALSATAPIQYNNLTGVISIPQSSASQDGYLSSADWNTFSSRLQLSQVSGESTFTTSITSTGAVHQQQVFTGSSDVSISVLPTPTVSTYMTIINNGTNNSVLTMVPTNAAGGFFGAQVDILPNECAMFCYNLTASKWFKV